MPEVDTIGIPVLTAPGGNVMFIPEMDGDFRITRFLDFYNEEQYDLDYRLPAGFESKNYSIGDPAPLPFWFGKACHVVEGDAEREDLTRMFATEAPPGSVLGDLGLLLEQARTGYFNHRHQRRTANDIAAGFSDVFYEPPVHSRYWVSRYQVAVAQARSLATPPHPVDIKLRRVAMQWLQRFAAKTDLSRLMAVLGKPEDGIISAQRRTEIVFAYLVNQLSTGNKNVYKHLQDPQIEDLFPYGLYEHFHRRGWPKTPFPYQKPNDLLDLLKEEIDGAGRTGDYQCAAKMTLLFFRRAKVPREIDDLVMPILNEEQSVLDHVIQQGEGIFDDRSKADLWSWMARRIFDQYNRLMDIDGILNGDARDTRIRVDRRFGVSIYYLRDLEKYL